MTIDFEFKNIPIPIVAKLLQYRLLPIADSIIGTTLYFAAPLDVKFIKGNLLESYVLFFSIHCVIMMMHECTCCHGDASFTQHQTQFK